MSNKITFSQAYSEAVSQGFKILGDQVSKIVIDYLEQKHSIKVGQTSINPKALDEALDSAIDGGRFIVERKIIRLLYEKLGIKSSINDSTGADFEKKIQEAQKNTVIGYPNDLCPNGLSEFLISLKQTDVSSHSLLITLKLSNNLRNFCSFSKLKCAEYILN
jgi:hypothetical protein